MTRLRLEMGDRDPLGLESEVRRRLFEFNVAATGLDDGRLMVVSVFGEADRLVAGLYGWTWGGSGFVDLLWVDSQWRGQGLGSRVLQAAEDEARARGCAQLLLSTHSFQAPGFYARRGFVERGSFEGYPTGHRQVHLAKPLA